MNKIEYMFNMSVDSLKFSIEIEVSFIKDIHE